MTLDDTARIRLAAARAARSVAAPTPVTEHYWATLRTAATRQLQQVVDLLTDIGRAGFYLPPLAPGQPPRALDWVVPREVHTGATSLDVLLTPQVLLRVHISYSGHAADPDVPTRLRYYGCVWVTGRSGELWGPPVLTLRFDPFRDWLIETLVDFEYPQTAPAPDPAAPPTGRQLRAISLDFQEEPYAGTEPQ